MTLNELSFKQLPKISLHDHLDGGLRPQTVIDLAAEVGHTLPASQGDELEKWFYEAANSGSLVTYLETFDHTVAVLQTESALFRVASEAVQDLAADGVRYAELRWAPEQHLQRGLSLQQTVAAVAQGIKDGIEKSSQNGFKIEAQQLITAMRHADRWEEIAQLAVQEREQLVAGFDIAGAELGFLPSRFPKAWEILNENNLNITIHAGEADGPNSIAEALIIGRAQRIGHGVRIIEDIDASGQLGSVARRVLDRQIPLELCPSSNLQTGAAEDIATHPITKLKQLGFKVTINPDNRLVSGTSLTQEYELLVDQAQWSRQDLYQATINSAESAFLPWERKVALIADIKAGWQK